jgi:hypothetical protein
MTSCFEYWAAAADVEKPIPIKSNTNHVVKRLHIFISLNIQSVEDIQKNPIQYF